MPRLLPAAALLGVAALALAPHAGHAQEFVTGTQLAQACGARSKTGAQDCDGFIAGALDVVAATPALKGSVCPPPHARLSALREAVGSFAQQHPEATKSSGVALLQAAMKASYPCPGA